MLQYATHKCSGNGSLPEVFICNFIQCKWRSRRTRIHYHSWNEFYSRERSFVSFRLFFIIIFLKFWLCASHCVDSSGVWTIEIKRNQTNEKLKHKKKQHTHSVRALLFTDFFFFCISCVWFLFSVIETLLHGAHIHAFMHCIGTLHTHAASDTLTHEPKK